MSNFLLNRPLSDFGRGTAKFQNFGKLLEVKESDKFKHMMQKMSCLLTVARMNDNLEVSQLIDVVNEFKISKKYLVIFAETTNITLLQKKTITFNVIIHHNESGESPFGSTELSISVIRGGSNCLYLLKVSGTIDQRHSLSSI